MKAKHFLLMCLLVLWLVGSETFAKPGDSNKTKQPPPPPDYFPLKLDYWWSYGAVSDKDRKEAFRVKVVSVDEQTDHTFWYTVDTQVQMFKPIQDIYSKGKGFVFEHHQRYLANDKEAEYMPTRPFIKNPLLKDDSWSWTGTGTAMNVHISENSKVGDSELVEVPAGKFYAMKVSTQVVQGGSAMTKIFWYAPWVGLVKSKTESGTVQSEMELLDYSFKPKSLAP